MKPKMHLADIIFFLLYRVMVRPTLEIGIDVGQRINLGDGKFSKKDKLIT